MTALLNTGPAAAVAPSAHPVHLGLHPLALPGVEQGVAYLLAYGRDTLRSLQRPGADQAERSSAYAASFHLTPSLRGQWHAFFRSDPTRLIPYLYAEATITLLHRRLLADLGMRPGQVQHLRQTTQLVRDAEPMGRVPRQWVESRLQRHYRLADGQVMVVVDTLIANDQGHALASVEDRYAVSGVDTAQLPGLQHDRIALAEHAALRQRRAVLPAHDANMGEWLVGADWGRRYAAVSGAVNPQHLGQWTARLLGASQATLPGTALRNLLVRQLADVGLLSERLVINLCGPVALNQRIRIVQRDDRFEVVCSQGRLLAFGRC